MPTNDFLRPANEPMTSTLFRPKKPAENYLFRIFKFQQSNVQVTNGQRGFRGEQGALFRLKAEIVSSFSMPFKRR